MHIYTYDNYNSNTHTHTHTHNFYSPKSIHWTWQNNGTRGTQVADCGLVIHLQQRIFEEISDSRIGVGNEPRQNTSFHESLKKKTIQFKFKGFWSQLEETITSQRWGKLCFNNVNNCPVFLAPLTEETVFSSSYILASFVIDGVSLGAWAYLLGFLPCSIDLYFCFCASTILSWWL